MRKHPVRKFFSLLLLYSAVIVGIFVLQFKTESVISRSIGTMRLTMAQTETENNIMELRNQLQVNFKGVTFSFDDTNPVKSIDKDGNETSLTLTSWEEDENSAKFIFNDRTTLTFAVSDTSNDADLFVNVSTPSYGANISIPYKTGSSYTIDNKANDKLILSTKNNLYSFTSKEFTDERAIFSSETSLAFTSYDPTKKFSFEMANVISSIDENTYNSSVQAARSAVIPRVSSLFYTAESDSLTEKQVIAYVAEMAFTSRYAEALDAVPDSFKKGNRRTYISSPYFDNLVNMNRSLVMQTEKFASMTDSAISDRNLEIFTVEGIADYILRIKKTSKASALLNMPSSIPQENFKPTLTQASSILLLYTTIYKTDENLASHLSNTLEACISTITDCLKLSEDNLSLELSENGIPANTELSVLTGLALIRYGKLTSNADCATTGFILASQALKTVQNIDTSTLCNIYPYIAEDNFYYPHTEILGYYGSKAVWAWTCAQNISYTIADEDVVNININYPLGLTHYLIINGVPTFHSLIEIQSMMFRTDPRFETYNSSGYVYQAESETLFLKSRHKNRTELIRLFCDPAANFTNKS